jgi:two-component system, sensor histidine kinase
MICITCGNLTLLVLYFSNIEYIWAYKLSINNATPRILIADDNTAIHEDIHNLLLGLPQPNVSSSLEEELFGETSSKTKLTSINYVIDDAYQGEEAINKVNDALREGSPYSMIFMDVRMPPGIDGIQAIKSIWKTSPDIEIVICTAFSDYSWEDIRMELGESDNLLFLKKPFDLVEIKQMALTLTKKWKLAVSNREHLVNLEARVSKRTSELKEAIDRLEYLKTKAEASTKAKAQFLSNMSHEIRTPLNGIMGMAELLLDSGLNEDQEEMARTITSSGESLKVVINDILDYSKIEAGRIEFENIKFNIRDTVESVIELSAINAQSKGIEIASLIRSTAPEEIFGDPERIRQILLNILSNAVKFTQQGEVLLDLYMKIGNNNEDRSSRLFIDIYDTGVGINKENLEKIFVPFIQSEVSTSREFGGTGLGLSISKQLAELMGGDISVTSTEGEGSKFSLEYPLHPSEYKKSSITLQSRVLSKLQSLFIGDNTTTQKVVKHYMENCGASCKTINTQLSSQTTMAYSQTCAGEFDIVFIDYLDCPIDNSINNSTDNSINNSIDNAARSINTLRENDSLSYKHIICFSPISKNTNIDKLTELGVDHIIKRPIKVVQFYNALLTLLGKEQNLIAERPPLQISTRADVNLLQNKNIRILLAEDNVVNSKILVRMLARAGVVIECVSNGEKAVEAFVNGDFNLILMDCHMPIMDGFEATRIIRSYKKGENIPIIAITADAFRENREKCVNEGMTDFVSKPFNFDRVISVIDKHTKKLKTNVPQVNSH